MRYTTSDGNMSCPQTMYMQLGIYPAAYKVISWGYSIKGTKVSLDCFPACTIPSSIRQGTRAPSQYPKRRIFVRSRKVSKSRDLYLELSDRSEIWQALRQHCCRCACQISKRYDNLKYQSHGFETSRDLTIRRLFGYWDGAQCFSLVDDHFHRQSMRIHLSLAIRNQKYSLIARFTGPTWGPSGADRTQMGPILVPWTLLCGLVFWHGF